MPGPQKAQSIHPSGILNFRLSLPFLQLSSHDSLVQNATWPTLLIWRLRIPSSKGKRQGTTYGVQIHHVAPCRCPSDGLHCV